MLATMTLAAAEDPISVWLGSTAGMVSANAIAVAIGAAIGTRLPERLTAWTKKITQEYRHKVNSRGFNSRFIRV
jgi:putative Ca2+/H+ antiporter (TMEM165/GDT1 family)